MQGFGDLEAALMELLWRRERPTTVREAMSELTWHRDLAYTTVMTVLDTLFRKGWLTREPDGRAYRYRLSHADWLAAVGSPATSTWPAPCTRPSSTAATASRRSPSSSAG